MCLAVPARIVELNGVSAIVELGGIRRETNVALIDAPQVGEYVLLHAGFAIQKWSAEDVAEFEAIMAEAGTGPADEEATASADGAERTSGE